MSGFRAPLLAAFGRVYKIGMRVQRQRSLSRELLDDQGIGRPRELTQFLGFQVIKGMRSDDHRQIVDVQILRGEPRMIQKCGGNNG